MPLLDHFRPPLSDRRHWHLIHNAWAVAIASQMNARPPAGYFAEPNVMFGVEIDVASVEDAFPEPTASIPLALTEAVVEVGVFSRSGGPTLAGAIALLSPGNKDRPASRDAFVSKAAAYIQAGVGLVVVDVVTDRHADLHADLLTRLGPPVPAAAGLLAAAYRPVTRDAHTVLDVWHEALAVGRPLPTMPLWLRGGLCLPVDLQAAYDRTCLELRIPAAA